jgi:hypothetical protein
MSFKEIEDLTPEAAVAKIARKPIHTLDADDKAFLRARESYLDEDQKQVFASILKEKPVVAEEVAEEVAPEVTTEGEVVAEEVKKGKKK